MAELFKYVYNDQFFERFIKYVHRVFPDFDKVSFLKQVYDEEWAHRELKQRMRHVSITLKNCLPEEFSKSAKVLLKIIQLFQKDGLKEKSVEYMFLPDFIEINGIDDFKTSIRAFEKITQFTSCEFGIRPFLIKYPKKGMEQMLAWSNHKHPMVRRLASEGCRPRLPWAMALPVLKDNPTPILPILENLKNDESESVRRSVANNLNDISKDNPAIVIALLKKWQGQNKNLDWLIKHGARTLLKQGNTEVLELFGFGSLQKIKVDQFKVLSPKVQIGAALEFSFRIINQDKNAAKIRLEYGLYYQKANGSLSKKVFKISEKDYVGNSITDINRKQSFRVITTRKFHIGLHQVSIIINGKELKKRDFELVE